MTKENIKKICGLIVFTIIVFTMFQNFGTTLNALSTFISILMPFLIGGSIAFILNVPLKPIERILGKYFKGKFKKTLRPVSILLSLTFVIGIIFTVAFIILPEVGNTLATVIELIPPFIDEATIFIESQFNNAYFKEFLDTLNFDWVSILSQALSVIQNNISNFFTQTISTASHVFGSIINFFLGLIFSIYLLIFKETLCRQGKMITKAYLPKKVSDYILEVFSLSNDIFSKFIAGQCIEAVILGVLFFFAMTVFKFPYALLISVTIGFLSLIPIFGAFVGCAIGSFLILIDSPEKLIWFIIMFLVIQQLEGNLIYPYVVGGSIGLPSIWVLVAVTLGGSLFGVLGMLLFIPLSAVFYVLFRKATINMLKEKNIKY